MDYGGIEIDNYYLLMMQYVSETMQFPKYINTVTKLNYCFNCRNVLKKVMKKTT